MIKIIKKGNEIKVFGHADYKEYGKDIVCASVSSIIYTTVNGIMNLDNKAISFNDDNDTLIIKILKNDDNTLKLIDNMFLLIKELAKDYPDNILIEE